MHGGAADQVSVRLAWARTGTAFLVGGVVTLAGTVSTSTPVVLKSQGTHLVLETVVTMVAALAALLSYGRYRRARALRDLLLVHSLALLALASLVFVLLPALTGPERGVRAGAWAALAARTAGAAGLLVASLLAPTLRRRRSTPVQDVGAAVALLAALSLTAVLFSDKLPDAVRASVAIESTAEAPALTAPVAVIVLQAVMLLCYAVASIAFTARSVGGNDDMVGWLGAAMALAAWARLAYLAYPSQFSTWLSSGDLLRLGCYLLLVVAAVRELSTYWERRTSMAVESERRRLARDLHDGVVQELGYIRSEAVRRGAAPAIASAADRAIFEARRAIDSLAGETPAPLSELLHRVADEVGERFGVGVVVDVDRHGPLLDGDLREALVRIAREALINAARHSGSPQVHVFLGDARLVVSDSGRGFVTESDNGAGFGLVAMKERAASLGAVVRVDSWLGRGTTVEVQW